MYKNVSPLRYPGGKTRACAKLEACLQEHFALKEFNTVISPFFGGGSFEFSLQNKYNFKLIVNDKFTPLYNFWKQVQENKTALCEALKQKSTVSKEEFANYRDTILQTDTANLEKAMQYFVINRCSFSGATLSGGFSEEASKKRYTPSCIRKIEALDLSAMEIYNLDFAAFIEEHTGVAGTSASKSLLFLDPPYYLEKKSKLYGKNGDMHEHFDHQKLFDLIKTKRNWLLTYNNCAYIKDLYKDYLIIETSWSYGMNKTKESSEIIIVSK
jgi:DNA adenine methylase